MAEKGKYGVVPKGPQQESFAHFIWNGEEGKFLGRTAGSWFKITVFYIIFYFFLALFWGTCFYIFYQTLSYDHPKWIGANGIIGSNPGIGFRPMPDSDKNEQSTLIWYNKKDKKDSEFWSSQLNTFIERADAGKTKPGVFNCTENDPAGKDRSCLIDTTNFKECKSDDSFGYPAGSPCILIKLNKIYDWQPDPYNDPNDLPDIMPQVLKDHIKTAKNKNKIWISCAGENVHDQENVGEINFYPAPGIDAFYFPYLKQDNYLAPFIFVHIPNPTEGVIINVECRAWAKNVDYEKINRVGSVHIELMIDSK